MSNNSDYTFINEIKSPTSFEEQVDILSGRGLLIEDRDFVIDVLSKVNYYRLSAYLLPFKINETNKFRSGTSFRSIYRLYEFDRKLRNIIIEAIESIEILVKTKLAYYHAHKYGAEGYVYAECFNNSSRHSNFISEFQTIVQKNNRALFVKHHIDNYNGHFPVWVAVELFSFGMLSKFYANMKPEDKKKIARDSFYTGADYLESWLVCLTDLRNRCAHYMRLYFHKLVSYPKLPRGQFNKISQRVFDVLYIMNYLFTDREQWKNEIVIQIEALITQYNEDIHLKYIGFPDNWLELLIKNPFQL